MVSGASAERTSGTPPIGGCRALCGPASAARQQATVVSSIALLRRALWLRPPLRGLASRGARGEPPSQRTCPFDGRLLRGHRRNRRVEHPVAQPGVVASAAAARLNL